MLATNTATEQFLRPIRLLPSDHLDLELTKDHSKFVATVWSPGLLDQRSQASNRARHDFFGKIPERRRLDDRQLTTYEIATTDITVAVIQASWPMEQITFAGVAERTMYEFLRVGMLAQEQAVRIIANWQDMSDTETLGLTLHPDPENRLGKYQIAGVAASNMCVGYNLHMEQGTGKTPMVIARICNAAARRDNGVMYRVFIACPKNVRSNWVSEFNKFATTVGKVTVLRGGQIGRVRDLLESMVKMPGEEDCRYTVVIASYEAMTRMIGTLVGIPWDLAVLDEAHYIARPEAKRTKAAMKLRDAAVNRMGLTGTPIVNTPLDVYSQLEFLGQGYSGFRSAKAFKKFYGVYINDEDSGFGSLGKLVGMQNLPFMRERLARTSFIIKKVEALPYLPEKLMPDIHEVTMTAHQAKVYGDLRDHLVAEAEAELEVGGGRPMVCNHVLTKMLRLAQITSGFMAFGTEYTDDGQVETEASIEFFDPNVKLEGLLELLRDKPPTDKTIVWAHWKPDLDAIHERLTELGVYHVMFHGRTPDKDREEAKRVFNYDRDCRVFVGSAGAGGTGLNLLGHPPGSEADEYDTDVNHVIYYSQDWSHPKRSQSSDRPHRRGTRRPVRYTDLVVPGTIDVTIRERVLQKMCTSMEVSNVHSILRAIRTGVIDVDD